MPKTNKISMKSAITVKETFEKFLTVKKAAGLSDKTLKSYGEHFRALEKILDTSIEMNTVSKEYFNVAVSALRDRGLRSNSIRSYTRTLKSFLGWCEGTFAAQKWGHNLRRLFRRGLEAAEEHCLLSATALNLKRMVKVMR